MLKLFSMDGSGLRCQGVCKAAGVAHQPLMIPSICFTLEKLKDKCKQTKSASCPLSIAVS